MEHTILRGETMQFIIGIVAGTVIGIIIMSLMCVASSSDDQLVEMTPKNERTGENNDNTV